MSEATNHDFGLVCVGGSAGSLRAVRTLLASMPEPGSVSVVLALHRAKSADDGLLSMLRNASSRSVREIDDLDVIESDVVYLCPSDYNVLVDGRHFSLSQFSTPFHSYPSIDSLFESCADEYRESAIAVALSCANADGLQGARRVRDCGGAVVAQQRDDAEYSVLIDALAAEGLISQSLTPPEIAAFISV